MLLLASAVVAVLVPTRRAPRVDPALALKQRVASHGAMATTSQRLLAKRDTELNQDERSLVSNWGSEAFGSQEWVRSFSWATPDWRLFLIDHDQPVSHVKLTLRRGRFGTSDVLFAGVGGVMTPRTLQRRGFSSALLVMMQDFVFSELRTDFGLLFCLPELTPFYGGLGWTSVKSAVYIEQPQGKIVWPKAAMLLPGSGTSFQDAEIDICGKPW